jgi:hypothetical protein
MSPQFWLLGIGSGGPQHLFGGGFLGAHVPGRGRGLRVTGEVHHAVQVAVHLPVRVE